MEVEGLLLKWAGYFAGWSEYFCVLQDGLLSIYDLQVRFIKTMAMALIHTGNAYLQTYQYLPFNFSLHVG